MSVIQYVLIGYGIGMVAYAVHTTEAIRLNKNDDPTAALLPHSPPLRAITATVTILLSPLWPWFLLGRAAGWLGRKCESWAERLRESTNS